MPPLLLPARLSLLAVVGVLLLAFGLRVHQVDAQSLWHDEGNSYVQSTRGLFEIAANAGRDIHPPGYYWLLSGWRLLTGESEFALRGLSVFASLLSIAFTMALGRLLLGDWGGCLAGGIVALNTFSIYYAQEARMYALLALWSAAALWAFVGFLGALHQARRVQTVRRWALLLALCNAAGLWTQYAFAFVMLAQGVTFVVWWARGPLAMIRAGRSWRSAAASLTDYIALNLLTLLVYLPWLPSALRQITTWPNTGEAISPGEALPVILGWLAFGITTPPGTTLSAAFFLVLGLLVFAEGRVRSPVRLPAQIAMLLPVVWVGVAVGVFLALGLFREANLKFLLPAQLGFALWLARGVWMLVHLPVRRASLLARWVPPLAAGLGMVALLSTLWGGVPALYTDPAYQRDNYRGLVARILAEAPPTAAVILTAPNQQEVFDYYARGRLMLHPLPRGLGGDDAATRQATEAVIAASDRLYAVLWGVDERDPNAIVETTLDRRAYEIDNTWYGSVRLVRYAAGGVVPESVASDVRFGELFTLRRAALSTTTLAPGEVLRLALEWTANAPPDRPYKIFVQLLNADGMLVAQRDSEPSGGSAPTLTWPPGAVIADLHGLAIPATLPPGIYRLIIGVYDANAPDQRLPVADGDSLTLAAIRVLPP